ncbi:MAG: aldehyde dehydrogenase [Tepidisphaeraceae bacterium]
MNAALVQDVVAEVMKRLNGSRHPAVPAGETAAAERRAGAPVHNVVADNRYGVFNSVDGAVAAATESQKQLVKLTLDQRDAIVKLIKKIAADNAEHWGRIEIEETKIGRLDHKIEKLKILSLVPGVEFLKSNATTGSNGVCLEEFAPFGVIGVVTPVTHSVPTLSANAVNMIASGNALVANAHPSGANCAAIAVRTYNQAIANQFGIENLIAMVLPPTLETADQLFNHRGVSLLVVTGGPQVARAALACRKRAIVAGPGNPPVVVDETACLQNAAKSIIAGAAFDNNLLCIGEKQVFVVSSVYDKLVEQLKANGATQLNAGQIDSLTKQALPVDPKDGKPHVAKQFVGKDAWVLAQAAGTSVPQSTQLLFGETDFSHPYVQEEQMMPFVPLVRVANVDEAIDKAIESEHGYRHTAICHSRNLDTITRYGRRAGTTLYVVNGASPSGLGLGGQGFLSYSIATPTGEGITTPLTFTRYRRVMITGSLRMI